MAVRLYAEFRSDRGDQYKIEIHDSQWLAAATEFNVDSRGFELTYEGETDDIVSPIVGSKLSFGMYINNSTTETFIETLKTFQENRFRTAVYVNSSSKIVDAFTDRVQADGGTIESPTCVLDAVESLGGPDGYSLYWAGWITQDLISIEDTSEPFVVQITSTDGIGKLSNIDYDVANDIDQGGVLLTRVSQMLINAVKKAGLSDFWGASDTFLETSADWWETTKHTYSTANDPLYLTAVDARLLQNFDSENNLVYDNAFEAIRQLATLFNARFFIQNGRWVFEQYGNRASSSRYVSRYDKSGSHLGRSFVADDVVVQQTAYSARKSGNNWDFLPAMRKAEATYIQKFLNPYGIYGGYRFTNTDTTFVSGFMAGGSGIQFGMGSAGFNFTFFGIPAIRTNLIPIFRATITLTDANGVVYYYVRAFNGTNAPAMFGTAAWTTTAGDYYFDIKAVSNVVSSPVVVTDLVQIVTDDLPTSGQLSITIVLDSIRVAWSNALYTPTIAILDAPFLFNIVNNGLNTNSSVVYTSINNEAGIDSALTLELGEIYFTEGPLQTGHIAVYDGTEWVGSASWRKGSSGAGLPIIKLLTNETLALHVRPIERYNGNTIGSQFFNRRLVFDSRAYLRTGGSFMANIDEWSGEMYGIQRIRGSVTELDEIGELNFERLALTSTTTGGVSTNDIDTGRIAGMVVVADENRIGPYEQTTTGGRINGTANITGVATMERTTIIGLESFVDTFAARVAADGGTIESTTCVSDAITALSGDSLVSLIPTDIAAPLTAAESVTMKKTLDVAEAVTMASTLDVASTASVQTIQLDTAYVPNGEAAGSLFWDPDAGIPAVGTIDGDRIDIGEKSVWYVKNQTGSTIAKGAAVYASGTLGSSGQILIAPMIADGTINAKYFLGLAQQPIDNGGDGYVVSLGKVRNVDTSAFTDGDVLYVSSSTAGALTASEPAAPRLKLPIAIVVKAAANGTISVRQTAGTYLAESHDVQISSPATNELLARTAEGRWENVELGAVLSTTTETPTAETSESFTAAFGTNSGTIMGEPSKWLPITIGGVNYLMPLYLAP